MTVARQHIFLNVPFDTRYERLFSALLSGVASLGGRPRCVLEIPSSERRLARIVEIIEQCSASMHDLSRVQLSTVGGLRVPRFNMPFELGIAYALHLSKGHRFFILEETPHRLPITLSDLNGFDPEIHGGTQDGMLRAVLNCLGAPEDRVTLEDLRRVHRNVSRFVAHLRRRGHTKGLLEPHAFRLTVAAATSYAKDRGLVS